MNKMERQRRYVEWHTQICHKFGEAETFSQYSDLLSERERNIIRCYMTYDPHKPAHDFARLQGLRDSKELYAILDVTLTRLARQALHEEFKKLVRALEYNGNLPVPMEIMLFSIEGINPSGKGRFVTQPLRHRGIFTVGDLLAHTEEDLRSAKYPGFGKANLELLQRQLRNFHLQLGCYASDDTERKLEYHDYITHRLKAREKIGETLQFVGIPIPRNLH